MSTRSVPNSKQLSSGQQVSVKSGKGARKRRRRRRAELPAGQQAAGFSCAQLSLASILLLLLSVHQNLTMIACQTTTTERPVPNSAQMFAELDWPRVARASAPQSGGRSSPEVDFDDLSEALRVDEPGPRNTSNRIESSSLRSNKSSRSVGTPLALEESRSVAESRSQHGASASDCALVLKRTYILRGDASDDDQEDRRAAASNQIGHDEWGDKFVFGDSDLADEKASSSESRNRRKAAAAASGGPKKKVHKSELCIRHSDVDKAIEEAKHRIKFSKPKDVSSPEVSERSIGSIGELNLATGLLLTKRFDLSHDEILNALPMIDMMSSHSLHHRQMDDLCPVHVKPMACSRSRFRTITGHCNNLKHPTWGASKTPYSRYLPPDYADGLNAPRAASDGKPLPSARLISSIVHADSDEPSNDYSSAFADWGQLLNHDITRIAVGEAPDCCPQLLKGLCMPIPVPANDRLYGKFDVQCLKFDRALAATRPKCLLGHRAQINLITSAVDASFVYGSTREQAQSLRAHEGGKMRVWNYFERLHLKPLLPPKTEEPDKDCLARPKGLFCFQAGDVRVNEQTHLTVLHTIYLREHNRIAKSLAKLNIDWDDERIYQETRHIVAAGVQHVMMNEFAPLLLGSKQVKHHKLDGTHNNVHWDGYDPNVTISTGTGFSVAAFRYGHSMVEGLIKRLDPHSGHFIKGEPLRFLFKRPFWLYEPGAIDQLVAGMLLTPAEETDPHVSEELSGHLFQPPKAKFGHDLAAINIQRGKFRACRRNKGTKKRERNDKPNFELIE